VKGGESVSYWKCHFYNVALIEEWSSVANGTTLSTTIDYATPILVREKCSS
jgi:hypothetical protein